MQAFCELYGVFVLSTNERVFDARFTGASKQLGGG